MCTNVIQETKEDHEKVEFMTWIIIVLPYKIRFLNAFQHVFDTGAKDLERVGGVNESQVHFFQMCD